MSLQMQRITQDVETLKEEKFGFEEIIKSLGKTNKILEEENEQLKKEMKNVDDEFSKDILLKNKEIAKLKNQLKTLQATGKLYEKTFDKKDDKNARYLKNVNELIETKLFLQRQVGLKDVRIAQLKDVIVNMVEHNQVIGFGIDFGKTSDEIGVIEGVVK